MLSSLIASEFQEKVPRSWRKTVLAWKTKTLYKNFLVTFKEDREQIYTFSKEMLYSQEESYLKFSQVEGIKAILASF